jgi:hypothetical protein
MEASIQKVLVLHSLKNCVKKHSVHFLWRHGDINLESLNIASLGQEATIDSSPMNNLAQTPSW